MASQRGRVTRVEFERAVFAAGKVVLPPHVVTILFHVFNDPNALGMVELPVMLECLKQQSLMLSFSPVANNPVSSRTGALYQTMVAAKSFAMGGVSGALGAFTVFPIDLVKVRMVCVYLRLC